MQIDKITHTLRQIAGDLRTAEASGVGWGAQNAINELTDLIGAIEDELTDARAQAKEDKEYTGHLMDSVVEKLD